MSLKSKPMGQASTAEVEYVVSCLGSMHFRISDLSRVIHHSTLDSTISIRNF
jgi:hypothetical protein